jgi:hypothetical protein
VDSASRRLAHKEGVVFALTEMALADESLYDLPRRVRSAWDARFPTMGLGPRPYLMEVYSDYAIATSDESQGQQFFQVPWALEDDEIVFDFANRVEVEQAWMPIDAQDAASEPALAEPTLAQVIARTRERRLVRALREGRPSRVASECADEGCGHVDAHGHRPQLHKLGRSRATRVLVRPLAHASTIRARCANACAVVGRRAQRSSMSCSSSLSVSTAMGRPIAMSVLLSIARTFDTYTLRIRQVKSCRSGRLVPHPASAECRCVERPTDRRERRSTRLRPEPRPK